MTSVECPICYEDFNENDLKIVECGHKFCEYCISRITKCALCRCEFTNKNKNNIIINNNINNNNNNNINHNINNNINHNINNNINNNIYNYINSNINYYNNYSYNNF